MSNRESNKWVVLVLVCFAQFMVVLDATIVNVALPSIQTDLGLSEANLQWIVNAYTLVFGGFLLLGGRAGDLIGRKRLFLGGIVVFTVASLLNGLAVNEGMLIGSRALQGLGAAFISPPRSRSSRPRSKRAPSAPARLASGPRSRSAARRSAWFSAACSPSCSPGRGSSSSTCRSAS